MGALRPAGVAIGAALDWEIAAILDALDRQSIETHRVASRTWKATLGETRLIVYRTGVGIRAARRSTRQLLERADAVIAIVINSGCAGALVAELGVGDAIVAQRIIGPPPELASSPTDERTARAIAELLGTDGHRTTAGALVSCRAPLLNPADKRQMAKISGAVAVDMESSGVRDAAAAGGVPFASLRVVLDPLHSTLPDLGEVRTRGRWALSTIAVRSLRSPRLAYDLAALSVQQLRAKAALLRHHEALFAAIQSNRIPLG